MKNLSIIICILSSFSLCSMEGLTTGSRDTKSAPLLSFDLGMPFLRINEENSTIEIAHRTYVSKDNKTTIQLIGMQHKALSSFYDSVQRMMANKVVLYESLGMTIEDSEKFTARIASLGNYFSIMQTLLSFAKPNALGLIRQPKGTSFYSSAAELIHADAPADEVMKHADILNKLDTFLPVLNDDEVKNRLRYMLQIQLHAVFGWDVDLGDDRNQLKMFALVLMAASWEDDKTGPSHREREEIEGCNQEIESVKQGQLLSPYKNFVLLERNNFIYEALQGLWARAQIPDRIAVVYGAAHLPFVEEFLLRNGYQPLKGSDEWLVATKLAPLSNIGENK